MSDTVKVIESTELPPAIWNKDTEDGKLVKLRAFYAELTYGDRTIGDVMVNGGFGELK